MVNSMVAITTDIWNTGCVTQQWKDGNIVNIYKKNGDGAVCSNSRGTSLLSTAGKVLYLYLSKAELVCLAEAYIITFNF